MLTEFRQGAGRLCLDFLRTLRYRGTPEAQEELATPEALAAWLKQFQPTLAAAVPTPEQVKEAQSLREAVHTMLQSARSPAGVASCPTPARRHINHAAAKPVPVPTLPPSGGSLTWYSDAPVTATLSLVARDALDLATSPAVARIRNCATPTCGVLFLDNSRPGTRRWCSMDTCGNRAKKNTLRQKATT